MSANEGNPVDAFRTEAPPRRSFGGRSLAARALVIVFAFFAALAAIAILVMAVLSQMQWQRTPDDLHDKYLPAVSTQVPPVNRQPTPADVGDVDESALPPAGGPDQQYRPTFAPGYQPSSPVERPYGAPSSAPYTTIAPPQQPARAPQATSPAPSPAPANDAPRAAPKHPRAALMESPADPKPGSYRRVAGKTFRQRDDGFLVDTAFDENAGTPVVSVVPGSPEYSKVLDEHRELAQFFRLSDRLILLSSNVVYRVGP